MTLQGKNFLVLLILKASPVRPCIYIEQLLARLALLLHVRSQGTSMQRHWGTYAESSKKDATDAFVLAAVHRIHMSLPEERRL